VNLKNPLILFDGECILCDSFIHFAIKRDKKKKFKLAYLQSEIAAQLGRDFIFDAAENLDAVILIKDNKVHTKSSAILRIAKELNGLWFLTVMLLIIPKIIRDFGYDFIGNRRYRWFGQKDKCGTDVAIIKSRLIH
jgi:predicted DCC family thiol-disulfide oxidoreductase YuxK